MKDLLLKVVLRDGGVRLWCANGSKLVPAVLNIVGLPGNVPAVVVGDDAAVLIASVALDSIVHFGSALDHRPVVPAAVGKSRLHDDFWVGYAAAVATSIAVAEIFAPLRIADAATAAIVTAVAA